MAHMEQVRRELLRAMRGDRSQGALNRRLGYSSNMVYRWESGKRRLDWREFVPYTEACKTPLAHALKRVFAYRGDPKRYDRLLRHLVGRRQVSDVAAAAGVSRSTVERWLKGTHPPSLDVVLTLMLRLLAPSVFVKFLGELVDIETVPSVKGLNEQREREARVSFDYPLSAAALRVLEWESYQKAPSHRKGLIARSLHISQREEDDLLQRLKDAGLIRWNKTKYEVLVARFDPGGSSFQDSHGVRIFWLRQALQWIESMKERPRASEIGYLLYSSNESIQEQVRQLYFDFFRDLRRVLSADDKPRDRLIVLNMHLLDPADAAG